MGSLSLSCKVETAICVIDKGALVEGEGPRGKRKKEHLGANQAANTRVTHKQCLSIEYSSYISGLSRGDSLSLHTVQTHSSVTRGSSVTIRHHSFQIQNLVTEYSDNWVWLMGQTQTWKGIWDKAFLLSIKILIIKISEIITFLWCCNLLYFHLVGSCILPQQQDTVLKCEHSRSYTN